MQATTESHLPENKEQIDLTYLKIISKGNKDFEKEILTSSLSEIEEKMQKLAAYVSLKEGKKISEQAHSLKSLCYIIGVPSLYEEFMDMEKKHLENGYTASTEPQYSLVAAAWDRVRVLIGKTLRENYSDLTSSLL